MAFQRVVCPMDGSVLSEQALSYAAEIAEKFGAPLVLLRAFDGPERSARMIAMASASEPMGMIDARTVDAVEEAAEEEEVSVHAYLSAQAERMRERGIDVEAIVADGGASDAILQEARREPDTLIVMSTHGRGGLGRLVFGSVAQEVLHQSDVPVLLVRAQEES